MVLLFPLQRRQGGGGGMQPTAVVPGDPGEDRGSCVGAGAVVVSVDQLDLEGGEPALGDGVVQARPGAAHGAAQPQPLAGIDTGSRGVFAAAVGVEDGGVHPLATAGGASGVEGTG